MPVRCRPSMQPNTDAAQVTATTPVALASNANHSSASKRWQSTKDQVLQRKVEFACQRHACRRDSSDDVVSPSSTNRRRKSLTGLATSRRFSLAAVTAEIKANRQMSQVQFTRKEESSVNDRTAAALKSFAFSLKLSHSYVRSASNLVTTGDAVRVPRAYKDTMKMAATREKLLHDARRYSPISLVLKLNKLPQTVFARLVRFPIVWVLICNYAIFPRSRASE